jgi:hypothetical protein
MFDAGEVLGVTVMQVSVFASTPVPSRVPAAVAVARVYDSSVAPLALPVYGTTIAGIVVLVVAGPVVTDPEVGLPPAVMLTSFEVNCAMVNPDRAESTVNVTLVVAAIGVTVIDHFPSLPVTTVPVRLVPAGVTLPVAVTVTPPTGLLN